MRENNPFEDTGTDASASNTIDPASANARDALNEPKKTSFLGSLKNRKKKVEPEQSINEQLVPADDFSSKDTSYSPLIDETEQVDLSPIPDQKIKSTTSKNTTPTNFQKKPPVAIDGVSPDYNTPIPTNQPVSNQENQNEQFISNTTTPRYEDFQPNEEPYQAQQEQPMIYQQPYQQNYYQPNDQYSANNQPLPVNYGTTQNIYDPYNPYATMVDLNPSAPDKSKKPDWKFIITLSAAIICFAFMIFFVINFVAANNSTKANEAEITNLQSKVNDGSKNASKVDSLETQIRELTEKNTDLTTKNNELQKDSDKVKELETQVTSLQDDKQSWQDKYYDALTRCGDKCANNSSSRSN